MVYSVPGYLTLYVMAGAIAVIATLLFTLRRALQQSNWSKNEQTKSFWSVSALLMAWFAFATWTSFAGWYGGPGRRLPTIQYGLFIPIVVAVLLFFAWPRLRRTLAIIPNEWLIGVQFYRILGLIFVVLYASARLPGLFALPAGVGDVSVGLLAPFAAAAYLRSSSTGTNRARRWNYLGIADLVVAVTFGFLTSPSPLQMAAFDRPSTLIGMFPLVLIPVYLVPLSILLHFASLHRLRQEKPASRVGPQVSVLRTGEV